MTEFHVAFRDLLHAVNLRRGTHSFTSLQKEGVLRIFFSPSLEIDICNLSNVEFGHVSKLEIVLTQSVRLIRLAWREI
jgi:hypothetical protein